jgi:hypothetical protein
MRCLLVLAKERFRECGKVNAYSAHIEFNVRAHGEHIRERKAPTDRRILTRLRVSFHTKKNPIPNQRSMSFLVFGRPKHRILMKYWCGGKYIERAGERRIDREKQEKQLGAVMSYVYSGHHQYAYSASPH